VKRAPAILVLLLSLPALADPVSYRLKIIPKGERKDQLQCFTLEEYKQLLVVDHELFTKRQESLVQQTKIKLLRESNQNLQEQVKLVLDNVRIESQEKDRLTEKWIETDRQLQEEKAKGAPMWSWVLGIGGGAALLTAAGILIGVYAGGGGK